MLSAFTSNQLQVSHLENSVSRKLHQGKIFYFWRVKGTGKFYGLVRVRVIAEISRYLTRWWWWWWQWWFIYARRSRQYGAWRLETLHLSTCTWNPVDQTVHGPLHIIMSTKLYIMDTLDQVISASRLTARWKVLQDVWAGEVSFRFSSRSDGGNQLCNYWTYDGS